MIDVFDERGRLKLPCSLVEYVNGEILKVEINGKLFSQDNNGHFVSKNDFVKDHIQVEHKLCSKCKKLKHYSEFHPNKHNKSGLQSWCKECYTEYHKKNNKKREYITDSVGHHGKFTISKKLYSDFLSMFCDNNFHSAAEVKELIKKHRSKPCSEKSLRQYASSLLFFVKKQKNINYRDTGRGQKRMFMVSEKKINHEKSGKNNNFFSTGEYPVKPNADGDRRFFNAGDKV